ncbi:ComF family protein [uncultured Clostridium sp.]|uniref:ComF family protein n=1 Tax=uncultured Clostridium sp. TaxID=59620 RepID=UPI0025CC40D3|nr:phosphoribosyltransferase family protein [uncultured Clostridium sp.]
MGKKFKTFIKILKNIHRGILEIIYPRESYCIICKEDDISGLCSKCRRSIIRIRDSNTKIESYGYYGGVLKELILKFKYYSNFTAGDILAEFLEEYIADNFDYKDFIITYIPLSKSCKRKRGFNQCQYLAERISDDLEIPIKEVLIKKRENKEQKKLKYNERHENIKGVFELKDNFNVTGLNLILIDDVTTSGATMEEGCRILKKYGAKQIKLLTLAKSQI